MPACWQTKGYLDGVLAEGAARADAIARRTLAKVYKKLAFCSCSGRAVFLHSGPPRKSGKSVSSVNFLFPLFTKD